MALPNDFAKQLEEQGRYILAAGLAEGRRVLDMSRGYAAGLIALAEANADELHVLTSDVRALDHALQDAGLEGVHVVAEKGWPLPYDDGAFDLIICHDLPERLSQNAEWAVELRRILSADGYLITAAANPQGQFLSEIGNTRFTSAVPYEALLEQIQPHFAAVSAFGQSPLTASLFFDFADSNEETGLTLDRSLLPDTDEQPGWFVVVFGPQEYHRDDLAIVQLPFDAMLGMARQAQPVIHKGHVASPEPEVAPAPEPTAEPEREAPEVHPDTVALEHAGRVIHMLEMDMQLYRTRLVEAQDAWLHVKPPEDHAARAALAETQAALVDAQAALVGSQAMVANLQRQQGVSQEVIAHLEADLAETRRLHQEALAQADTSRTLQQDKDALRLQVQSLEAAVQTAQASAAEQDRLMLRVQTLEAESTLLQQSQLRLAQLEQELLLAQQQKERLGQIEQEVSRARHDRGSFETQIRDLMDEVASLRQAEEVLQTALQSSRDALQTQSAEAARDKAHMEHEQARMATEVARERQVSASATAPATLGVTRHHDAVGRELDTAVEELEDLLKDVAPPISSTR